MTTKQTYHDAAQALLAAQRVFEQDSLWSDHFQRILRQQTDDEAVRWTATAIVDAACVDRYGETLEVTRLVECETADLLRLAVSRALTQLLSWADAEGCCCDDDDDE